MCVKNDEIALIHFMTNEGRKKVSKYASETEAFQLRAVGSNRRHRQYIALRLQYGRFLQQVWKVDLTFLCMFSHLSDGCLLSPQATREFTLLLCVYSLENIKPILTK